MKYSIDIVEDLRGLAVLTVDAPTAAAALEAVERYADRSQRDPNAAKIRAILADTLRKAATV